MKIKSHCVDLEKNNFLAILSEEILNYKLRILGYGEPCGYLTDLSFVNYFLYLAYCLNFKIKNAFKIQY